jgi:hypothetical protein
MRLMLTDSWMGGRDRESGQGTIAWGGNSNGERGCVSTFWHNDSPPFEERSSRIQSRLDVCTSELTAHLI